MSFSSFASTPRQPPPSAPAQASNPGDREERGYVNQTTVVASGAWVGNQRRGYSGGGVPSVDNNNVMKAVYLMWPEPVPPKTEFPGSTSFLSCCFDYI